MAKQNLKITEVRDLEKRFKCCFQELILVVKILFAARFSHMVYVQYEQMIIPATGRFLWQCQNNSD